MDSPLAWVGGKRILRKQIIPLIPEDHTCYIEVFAGGSWVLFGKEPSKVEVINDRDGELINFYQIVQKHPAEFSRQARQLLVSRRLFELLKRWPVEPLTDIERAVRFYYLIRASFAAKGAAFGVFIDRRPRWNPATFQRHFREISSRLQTVTVECLDFAEVIERYDRPWTLFYCDPPYIGSEAIYNAPFSPDDHQRLADVLQQVKGRFILSYNDHPDVWARYKGCIFRQAEGRRPPLLRRANHHEFLSISPNIYI